MTPILTDYDVIGAMGFSLGFGFVMGLLFVILLFYWRRETM